MSNVIRFFAVLLPFDSTFITGPDRYDHLVGDKMLQRIGKIFARSKRLVDIAARYGGDEFVMILPDTSKREAFILAERLRG